MKFSCPTCTEGFVYCHCELRGIDWRKFVPEGVKMLSLIKEDTSEEACGFCDKPCGNEWCCMNEDK